MTHILLGVSGSISAYKTPEIVRHLRREGWDVTPILSKDATQFVTPLSLSCVAEKETITHREFMHHEIPHLKLAKSADVLICAPLSANTLSALSSGWANEPVSATFSAFDGPSILCPAMHTEMWIHPSVQSNLSHLTSVYKSTILGPDKGELASGDTGIGRLVDPRLISLSVYAALNPLPQLRNKRVIVTAGGTSEKIDTVRKITNSSTGMSGEILAHMASLHGAKVTLISSQPLGIPNPHLVEYIPIESVSELETTLQTSVKNCDYLYMAAAVSDFTCEYKEEKISRSDPLTLTLTQTPDLLRSLFPLKGSSKFIGYCLSDTNLEAIAKQKLDDKGLDSIIANTSDQIGNPLRTATIYSANGSCNHIDSLKLPEFSNQILDFTV